MDISAQTLHESYSTITLKQFFVAMIGFLSVMALMWIYLVILSWIMEYKHAISIRKISFFKILTFGKLNAAEVSPVQIFWIWLIAHVVIILAVSGALSGIIMKVITYVISLYYKLIGGA
ncbi:MAG: hypothetical protein IJJ59_10100 [Pseudobutyrivibrio sp.]|uniref:hypothetical protein n=1 Tax=Pseudobutyrivibrio sp. TaxID=2014367 RepID=UPI0025D6F670|nr:hypothetical protein [Pseudobutyrivibrio sp.]MBQ6463662.1 hypothetical protein [Pseudobutyrivibrio sp.]